MKGKYDDIINLPHHVSSRRAPMTMIDRAAQFSPFAALTGYDAAIQEAGRLTEGYITLAESAKESLNEKLQLIQESLDEHPEITVTYFKLDDRKNGGAYVSVTGTVKKIDEYIKGIIMTDGTEIYFDYIYSITGELFRNHE